MATASISKDTDTYTISGGSDTDPITLKDVQAATDSDLLVLNRNAVTTSSSKAYEYVFDSSSYVDLTDARVFLKNGDNNQNLYFSFNGHISVGGNNDALGFCEIHFGDKDSGGYSSSDFPLFGTTDDAYINCPNVENRIKVMSHLDGPNSSRSAEPGAANGVWIQNNRSGNSIRFSILGASHTYGSSYVLPDPDGFKPNGTMIVNWRIGPDVPIRDIEFRDGYVDWRPGGTWGAPTRGIFVSETWMKFLGSTSMDFTNPLVFGNSEDSFEVVVGRSGQTGSYLLHGLYSSGSAGRIVYNNFKGLTWSTQMALYGGGDDIRVENHLSLSYKLIDSFSQPIEGAEITIFKKDPVYGADNDTVDYSGSELSFTVTSDSSGEGNIGNDDGDLSDSICVEAFCRRDTGGNVDTDYANKDHDTADYASYTSLYYTIIKWGNKPIIRQSYTAKLSGEVGEGKQGLGVIQLENDLSVSASTENDVASTITDAESLYDNAYKYALDNKINTFTTREGSKIITNYEIVFDNSATDIITFDGSSIIVKTDSFSGSIEAQKITFITPIDLSTLSLKGEVHYNTGADTVVNLSRVTVIDPIYNDDVNHTLLINLKDTSTATAGDPGDGNGETNIQQPVPIQVIVKDITSGDLLQNARVLIQADQGGDLEVGTVIVNELTDEFGEVNKTINYTSDQPIKGKVRKATP